MNRDKKCLRAYDYKHSVYGTNFAALQCYSVFYGFVYNLKVSLDSPPDYCRQHKLDTKLVKTIYSHNSV